MTVIAFNGNHQNCNAWWWHGPIDHLCRYEPWRRQRAPGTSPAWRSPSTRRTRMRTRWRRSPWPCRDSPCWSTRGSRSGKKWSSEWKILCCVSVIIWLGQACSFQLNNPQLMKVYKVPKFSLMLSGCSYFLPPVPKYKCIKSLKWNKFFSLKSCFIGYSSLTIRYNYRIIHSQVLLNIPYIITKDN